MSHVPCTRYLVPLTWLETAYLTPGTGHKVHLAPGDAQLVPKAWYLSMQISKHGPFIRLVIESQVLELSGSGRSLHAKMKVAHQDHGQE